MKNMVCLLGCFAGREALYNMTVARACCVIMFVFCLLKRGFAVESHVRRDESAFVLVGCTVFKGGGYALKPHSVYPHPPSRKLAALDDDGVQASVKSCPFSSAKGGGVFVLRRSVRPHGGPENHRSLRVQDVLVE